MANIPRIRSAGLWVNGSVVDPEEFEQFDEVRPYLINAQDGSTHAPTAPVIIGGQGIEMTGPLVQDAASTWTLNGAVNLATGSALTLAIGASATMQGGYTLTTELGSDIDVAGNITWQANNWPRLTSRTVTRRKWHLAWTKYTGGTGSDPGTPRAWTRMSDAAGSAATAIQTAELTASVLNTFAVELTELPPGAVLETVTIKTKGTAGDSSVNLSSYQLARWLDTEVAQTMSAATADAHTGSNWLTDVVDTVLTCNAHATIESGYRYGIIVDAPYGTTAAAMQMYSFVAELDATSIQL